nr:immunoglobulin light chain junction region [Macaca mulatta]MOV62165.1 immunoglobulin light chain junction region [Macaca mulatta]MOV62363.1 immunoglobulin light chain junction region [Macaca mulatta]MOV62691.1 immunoglobulin light chain junction region [Macaca mulatta]MOV64043.1 immunoglobulin light chain junction region [Macaca mulatta]
CQQHNNYPLTF